MLFEHTKTNTYMMLIKACYYYRFSIKNNLFSNLISQHQAHHHRRHHHHILYNQYHNSYH